MAKFNITVDIDWIDEEYNVDDIIKDEIISSIVPQVKEKILKQAEDDCTKKINSQMAEIENTISQKLNSMMDEFFSTPKDITDKYGDVIEHGVTVKDKLKSACDKFLEQPVDDKGNPSNGWNPKYASRVDYLVAKSMDHDMEWTIKRTVDEVTNNLKKKITEEVKDQLGNKLANILDLNKLI